LAGSGRRVFNPGEVLTASNVMNYLQDQSVMVFANTAARGSAIGTAVSKGMVTFQKDTNEVTVYDGSVWKTAYPANASDIVSGTLAVGRGGTGSTTGAALVPMIPPTVNFSGGTATGNSNGTISFAGSTSISLNGAFSTYTNFRIVMSLASQSNSELKLRLRVAGVDHTSGYYAGNYGYTHASNAYSLSSSNSDSFRMSWLEGSGGYRTFVIIDISRPTQTENTMITGTAAGSIGGQGPEGNFFGGQHLVASAYDGFTFYPTAGVMAGDVTVYGYKW
jgi:hypothetical protein